MTKTEHYQLNQWVPEDPVRREDFNQDNLNIENALVAHDEAVSAALKEHKEVVTAALETHKSEVTAELIQHEAAVDTHIAAQDALIAENCLFKLGEFSDGARDSTVDLDLSGVDLDQYRALVVLFRSDYGASIWFCGTGASLSNPVAGIATFLRIGSSLVMIYHVSASRTDGSVGDGSAYGSASDWAAVQSMTFRSVIEAAVYGLKM